MFLALCWALRVRVLSQGCEVPFSGLFCSVPSVLAFSPLRPGAIASAVPTDTSGEGGDLWPMRGSLGAQVGGP